MSIGSRKNDHIEKLQIILQLLVQFTTLLLFKLFFSLRVEGQEKALENLVDARKEEKGILFTPNHISEWDAIMVRCALPLGALSFPLYYVAMTKDHYQYEKFGWRKYLYGGTFFKILGAYPAYLGMRDYQASLVNHVELLEYGKSVCIFPEGKISVNTLKPGEVKGGVGFLAQYTQTNIIPVTVKGFERINWSEVFLFKRPEVSIVYHDLVKVSDVVLKAKKEEVTEGIETYKFIGQHVMNIVRG